MEKQITQPDQHFTELGEEGGGAGRREAGTSWEAARSSSRELALAWAWAELWRRRKGSGVNGIGGYSPPQDVG